MFNRWHKAPLLHWDAEHEKTRALAREFLNDWDTFWVVLDYPWLPLTNNEAERALRHWVIARRISYGTRTEQGSRAFALTISVIGALPGLHFDSQPDRCGGPTASTLGHA